MTRIFSPKALTLAISAASLYSNTAIAQISQASELGSTIEPAIEPVMESVMVTGKKIEQNLQETKESVAVFTENMLQQRNLVQLSDVIQQTPGVSGTQFKFYIRGVRSTDGASKPEKGDLASIVIDGVTTSGWVKGEAISQLWDVGQVEVLRGPQSTNLGRNALAGALIINTNDPIYENESKLRAGLAEYGSREYKAMANINLIDGVSALRISAEQNESDGFINNTTRNEKDFGGRSNDVYRLKWLLEPSDDLRMVLSYMRIESKYGDFRSHTALFDIDERIMRDEIEAVFDTTADLLSFTAQYDFADNWSFKSISAYQGGKRFRQSDADQTPDDLGLIVRNSKDDNLSQELRLNYSAESVRGSTGLYYAKIDARRNLSREISYNLVTLFNDFAPGLGGLFVQNLGLYPQFYATTGQGKTEVETTNLAFFTEWELDLDDKWTTSFGLRYDNEEQSTLEFSRGTSSVVLPGPQAAPVGTQVIGLNPLTGDPLTINEAIGIANFQLQALTTNIPETQGKGDFDAFLPHAGITYRWNEDVSSSFFVTKSYRSGGRELTFTQGINDFDQEQLSNYELALRAVVLDAKGVFNANLYYSDWKDQQVDIQEPGTSNPAFRMTVNAGQSELYGLEASFTYEMSENLSLFTGAAYNKTEYKVFSPEEPDIAGNEFRFAPNYTANAGFTFEDGLGFFFNASANFSSSAYSNLKNTAKVGARTLFRLSSGYDNGEVRIEAFINNLFDKTYATNNALTDGRGNPLALLGAPRMVGARATWSF